MDERSTDDQLRDRAIRRLRAKAEFRRHLAMYVLVNALLVVIWALTSRDYFWPIWPILGWGIGIGFHAWDVYGRKDFSEDDIRREIDRLR